MDLNFVRISTLRGEHLSFAKALSRFFSSRCTLVSTCNTLGQSLQRVSRALSLSNPHVRVKGNVLAGMFH